jgi:hypothetical protein
MRHPFARLFLVAFAAVVCFGAATAEAKGGSGRTPFDVSAVYVCDGTGTIAWAATVGTAAGQAVWVKVDFTTTIALPSTPSAGTYTGAAPGFANTAHTVLFRRVMNAKVEEQVTVITSPCI